MMVEEFGVSGAIPRDRRKDDTMKSTKSLCTMSVDDILTEAIRREKQLAAFYQKAVCEIGPDVCSRIQPIIEQGRDRLACLEQLRSELSVMRDLSTAMAD